MHTELSDFMKALKSNKVNLTRQQYKTVRGRLFPVTWRVPGKVWRNC